MHTNGVPCDFLAFTSSVWRCMSNHHVNVASASEITPSNSFKVMDVEEPELIKALVGLLWGMLQNERQRRHVARLRPGRNIVQCPIVKRRSTTSELVGDALARC